MTRVKPGLTMINGTKKAELVDLIVIKGATCTCTLHGVNC